MRSRFDSLVEVALEDEKAVTVILGLAAAGLSNVGDMAPGDSIVTGVILKGAHTLAQPQYWLRWLTVRRQRATARLAGHC